MEPQERNDQEQGKAPGEPRSHSDPGIDALARSLRISFRLLQALILLLLILFIFSGVFVAQEGTIPIVLHLGKIRGGELAEKGGLRWAWPAPIDRVEAIPAREQVMKLTSMWIREENLALPPGKKLPDSLLPGVDGYCITGDSNIVHTLWTLHYKVIDPVDYFIATNNESPREILNNLLSNAVVMVVGSRTADEVLRRDVRSLQDAVKLRLNEKLRRLHLGVVATRLYATNPVPPLQVQGAFDAETKAGTTKSTLITQAQKKAAEIIQEAQAKKERILAEAEGYRARLAAQLEGDASTMRALFPGGKAMDRDLLEQIFLEQVSEALSFANEIFLVQPDRTILRLKIENLSKYKVRKKKGAKAEKEEK